VTKTKKKRGKAESSDSEEVMPSKVGSRTRPGPSSVMKGNQTDESVVVIKQQEKEKEIKIVYPNKKHQVSISAL